MAPPPHIAWLVDTGQRIKTTESAKVEVWELRHVNDAAILSEWAKHFRNHYCADDMLDGLIDGTGLTRAEFLNQRKFPSMQAPGPSIRAGDFAEILISDFIEFTQGYWCPRERFAIKWIPNESIKGSDVIGFRFATKKGFSEKDEMFVLEAKADMTGSNENRLQIAVNDSTKDPVRHAVSLSALKQRYLEQGRNYDADAIKRFQNPTDSPFKFRSGAVLVCSEDAFDPEVIKTTVCAAHSNRANLTLIVVKGDALMALVHALYERAANEA